MMKIKFNLSDIVSHLLLLFIILITIGAYLETNVQLIEMYILISIFLILLKPRLVMKNFQKPIVIYWMGFIAVVLLSNICNNQLLGNKFITACISVFFIIFVFSNYWETENVFKIIRNFILVLCIMTIITYFSGFDFFSTLKTRTSYTTVDVATGGIASIFEFRHYYALYISIALLTQIRFPFANKLLNGLSLLLLVANIFLTSTRTIWFALAMLYFWSKRRRMRFVVSKNKVIFIFVLLFSVLLVFPNTDIFKQVWSRILQIFDSSQDVGGVRIYTLTEGTSYIFQNWQQYLLLGGGTGFSMEWLRQNPYGYWVNAIDNQYVTIFMNFGAIGLLIFIVPILMNLYRRLKNIDWLYSSSMFILLFSMFFFEIIGSTSSVFVLFIIVLFAIFSEDKEVN